MKDSSYPQLQNAIDGIIHKLGIKIDADLQHDYQNGKYPNLLSYEKVEKSSLDLPAMQKYLIGAQAVLNQPSQFYDIFRSPRQFFFIQILNDALNIIFDRVKNYDGRLSRLLHEKYYDPFDAVFYEIVVAAQYACTAGIADVTFIEGRDQKLPDFEFFVSLKKYNVECKKFDRSTNIVTLLRDAVRNKLRLTFETFVAMHESSLFEISFQEDPRLIPDAVIRDACMQAVKLRSFVKNDLLEVIARQLPYQKLDEYTLYPSPMYYWARYGYRETGEWFGIANVMNARYARHIDNHGDDSLSSTWLDDVNFDCVIKWKITNEDIIWKYKRLGYSLLFKGLDQLTAHGTNSILHAWYERDGSLGNRRNELLDFYKRLSETQKDVFSWIIFNETLLDVSVEGRFDLIEHAHPITGPTGRLQEPFVTTVFTRGDEEQYEDGAFGIGPELPSVDDIFKGNCDKR